MDCHLVAVQQHNAISRGLGAIGCAGACGDQRDLMVQAGERGEGDPVPLHICGSMYVTIKHMSDVAALFQNVGKLLMLYEFDVVDESDADIKWWVVHEQVNRRVPGIDQLGPQPIQTLWAQLPLIWVGAVAGGVQKQEQAILCLVAMLDEPIVVTGMIVKDA